MLILIHGSEVFLYQRPKSGIWGGLYSYPEFEEVADMESYLANQGITAAEINYDDSDLFRHTFSHYHLDIQPVYINLIHKPNVIAEGKSMWFDIKGESAKVGQSAVTEKLLAKLKAGDYL